MWVVYITPSMSLVVRSFNGTPPVTGTTSYTINRSVQTFCKPTISAIDSNTLSITYLCASIGNFKKLVTATLNIPASQVHTETVFDYLTLEPQYSYVSPTQLAVILISAATISTAPLLLDGTWKLDGSQLLSGTASQPASVTQNELFTTSVTLVDVSSTPVTTAIEDLPESYPRSLTFASSNQEGGQTTQVVYAISKPNEKSEIRAFNTDNLSPHTIITMPTTDVSDITAVIQNNSLFIIASATIYDPSTWVATPRYFYISSSGGNYSCQPFQHNTLEMTGSPRLTPKSTTGYWLHFVTSHLASQPKSILRIELPELNSSVPQLSNIVYRRPYGFDALDLDLQDQVGVALVKNGQSQQEFIYYDPIDAPLNPSITPSTVVTDRVSPKSFSVTTADPDACISEIKWSSDSPLIHISDQSAATTNVYIDPYAPDATYNLSATVYDGVSSATATTTITPTLHQSYTIITPAAITTAYATPINIPVTTSNTTPAYPIQCSFSFVVPTDASKATITKISDSLCRVTPTNTSSLGDFVNIRVTSSDGIVTQTRDTRVTVMPISLDILGDGILSISTYHGTIRLANSQLGFVPSVGTSLRSDFTSTFKYLGPPFDPITNLPTHAWIFVGSKAVLWVLNWSTQRHTYMWPNATVVSAAVSSTGTTGILTDATAQFFAFPSNPRAENPSITVPTERVIDINSLTTADPINISCSSSAEVWAVSTNNEIILISDQIVILSKSDLKLSDSSVIISVDAANVTSSTSGYISVTSRATQSSIETTTTHFFIDYLNSVQIVTTTANAV